MKKSTLALSIAAALGGLGMAGNALAVTSFAPSAAGSLVLNADGRGHQLVFPYFTAQNGNATLMTITNTDTVNGKLVKVRFRGAANSDDLYDFQVALSPGDVWTAAVTKDATTGAAMLSTADKSCTVPAVVNGAFNTQRVDGKSAAQTLEGYVEVINMADIPPLASSTPASTAASALYTAIKHVKGVAPCTATEIAAKLGTDDTAANLIARGMAAPTTGLTGDWIILNQNTTAAWSGSATALEVRNAGVAAAGNLVFWPQTTGTPAGFTANFGNNVYTADPLLVTGVVAAQNYDLPDMSTPYAGATTANAQADATTAVLAVSSVSNQYATESIINGVTDILFSQPMRRYSAAVNYTSTTLTDANGNTLTVPFATSGTRAQPIYRGASDSGLTSTTLSNVAYKTSSSSSQLATAVGTGSAYYGPSSATAGSNAKNLSIPSGKRDLCLTTISGAGQNTIFDREETTPAASSSSSSTTFVISPATPATTPAATPLTICGEAAVVSINNGNGSASGALSASIALSDISATDLTAYQSGWITFNTAATGNTMGLPIIGGSFMRAANGKVNYGFYYANKVTRPAAPI
jgi:hypothetical protein